MTPCRSHSRVFDTIIIIGFIGSRNRWGGRGVGGEQHIGFVPTTSSPVEPRFLLSLPPRDQEYQCMNPLNKIIFHRLCDFISQFLCPQGIVYFSLKRLV